ncbi:Acyl-udp-n-acetylglucosamine o-acyltransferase [Thalictrum thalictroides]|uniref:Acyl-udp-n-acetylglucosamine o-acyltransferase n=1 Tax=Thalictrum thalictroides TaxID=46969 RepID=A0A7J6USW2_THATH|nr:Acyl-udp-n-acetylglucosamine o-acyltransferase [Thalictrum thalictroides]
MNNNTVSTVVDTNVNSGVEDSDLVIPGVLCNDQKCSLNVKLIGYGEIGVRLLDKLDKDPEDISRIWCAWLGENCSENDEDGAFLLTKHEFGVVIFSYHYDLGREPVLGDFERLSASSSKYLDDVNIEGKNKRMRKAYSDPEDISTSLSKRDGSMEDYQLLDTELGSASRSTRRRIRKEMRQRERLAAERTCDICYVKLLPGKDVACLLNMKTGRLACSSRNSTGAFHLFHTSCLIHWILLCEFEKWTNNLIDEEIPRQTKSKTRTRRNAKQKDNIVRLAPAPKHITSVFCPECQGAGIHVEKDQLEKPTIGLAQMFNQKLKLKDGQRSWMKSPEILQKCSVGLKFLNQSEGIVQETVASLKLIQFYRAAGQITQK